MKSICLICMLFVWGLTACDDLIDVGNPVSKVTGNQVFASDTSAIRAVVGIYSLSMAVPLINASILNGEITILTGLSGDELVYNGSSSTLLAFYNNSIQPDNSLSYTNIWFQAYTLIYQINACIEGLSKNNSVTANVANQLLGECYFLRALLYFNMVQLFGAVPLITTTDYEKNAAIPRTQAGVVIDRIKQDLTTATNLLSENYPTADKARVNKWAATALLARVHLYNSNWTEAADAASLVINSGGYDLEHDLSKTFLIKSKETILQFMPVSTGYNTMEGAELVPSPNSTSKPTYTLNSFLLNSFEGGDKRLSEWTGSKTVNGVVYRYPYKYK